MNLDEVMQTWRAADASRLFAVDRTVLHGLLRREQAKVEKQRRRMRRLLYVVTAVLVIAAGLFSAILFDPNQPQSFSARLVIWDYVVVVVGVSAALVLVGALFAARRSLYAHEQGFGDSLRDHLRRRIAQLDAAVAGERRLALITVAAMLVCATAISILSGRIKHVPVPWSETDWPSPIKIVVILGLLCLLVFRWLPREREHNVQRKQQLEALLKEFDGQ